MTDIGMLCPACGQADASGVKDGRPQPGGTRRRRVCACGHRFRTLEVAVGTEPVTLERVSVHGCVDAIRVRFTEDDLKRRLADRITEAVNAVLGV
jgi:hypothetical protein